MPIPFPAWAVGLLCGFVACVPLGPVNLTVIDQALRRGFRVAFLAGLGAICAETIYAGIALAGRAQLPENRAVELTVRTLAVLVVFGIGLRNLFRAPAEDQVRAIAARADQRWHHPRAWLLGFLLTISNLTLLLLWATLAAMLFAHGWVRHSLPSRTECLGGVFTGGLLWYSLLAAFVAHAHRQIRPGILHNLVRASGVVFLCFGALLAYKIIRP